MKLKYIIASFIAAASVLVGCVQENPISFIDGLTVSNDYVTIAAEEGSSVSITVNGAADWTIAPASEAEWLAISPASGAAGQDVTVKFTATASEKARNVEVHITMGEKVKIVKVNQKAPEAAGGGEVAPSTCKEVIDGPDATYRVRGTVTRIANTSYGNWYLADDTGEIYIYGTFNSKSQYPKDAEGGWASFGIEVGDIVTVEGPKTVYNGTVELVDVSIIKIEKSLIDVAAFDFDKLPAADTTFNLVVSAKESPLLVNSDAAWLVIEGVNADGSYLVHAAENVKTAERTANISIKGPTARKSVAITQKGIEATGSTVSEIIAMEDDSMVKTLPSTIVVALTTKGAVLSDGTKAIYAFGDAAAALKVGDGVSMGAKKTTYNGVPELTDLTDVFVDSEGNEVSHPEAVDVTANAGDYAATEAEYIKLTGTVSITLNDDGTPKYVNLALDAFPDGSKQGSITNPVADLNIKSFDGKKVTVTGYFNGLASKGKFINIVATKVVEYAENPKGTATNPYTPSEIAAVILGGNIPDEDVYIKGTVSAVLYTASTDYPTATFWISDDGVAHGVAENKKSTTEPTKDFECYSVYWFGNQPWADGNGQVTVGDEVVVCGKTTVYNGVAETSSKKAWLYSVNYVKTAGVGLGSTEFPFNVAGAEEVIDFQQAEIADAAAADAAAPVFKDVCVKGKISAILYTFSANYGTGTFWISDDGVAHGVAENKKSTTEPTKDFECYSVYWFNNQPWVDGNAQPAEGDEVIVKGQLTKYNTTYETSSKKAWVYSLNGATE